MVTICNDEKIWNFDTHINNLSLDKEAANTQLRLDYSVDLNNISFGLLSF